MSERASVFENSEFDIAGFAPKKTKSARSDTPPESYPRCFRGFQFQKPRTGSRSRKKKARKGNRAGTVPVAMCSST